MYKIERLGQVSETEMSSILEVWEASVRATHDFLTEKDIEALKPEVRSGVKFVEYLYCMKRGGIIIAFLGVHDCKIEMLFVGDAERHNGIGKALVNYAIDNLSVNAVDVNEQNPQAVGFYQFMGFAVSSRSELDDQGNPFPILHMKL